MTRLARLNVIAATRTLFFARSISIFTSWPCACITAPIGSPGSAELRLCAVWLIALGAARLTNQPAGSPFIQFLFPRIRPSA